jgi:hypothetical protein
MAKKDMDPGFVDRMQENDGTKIIKKAEPKK